ncbi:MAG: hypothetical protein LBG59_07565 [Candidatus Peribacteria bacterium]|jgi:hypothetical protein|nr:hypothetical protein [Candidatus Peribacteria bacterium]
MYFFTKDTIEVFTTSSTLEVGGLITVYTTPIAGENRLANDKCTVVADDMVFFLTKGNQIKSLEFRQGFTEISVGDITNRPNQSIQNFLDRLDPEQPTAFGYFHKEKKLVFFHLRERGEKFNNITLVYDVNANCFLVDNNKFYSDVAKFNGKYYATSGVNSEIYEDESENSDNGIPIERERRSITYYIGNPNYRKEFREINITGENDALNEINIDVVCDGKSAFSTKIA